MFTILFLLGILCFCIEFLIMKRLRYTKGYGVEEGQKLDITRGQVLLMIIINLAPIVNISVFLTWCIWLCISWNDFYLDNSGKILGKIMNFLNKKIN